MRLFPLCAAFALACAGVVVPPSPAHAQNVSESERLAAREQFMQGDQLQREGKFAEALEKFQRAQRLFSAPTNLLRVAQCQAALHRLVEATTTYRTLINTPLPAGSPAAFQQAIDQARAELPQVEPRVPRIKIDILPKDIPNLTVQVDGERVNPVLIGEPLARDPGTHRINAIAPGYAPAEATLVLRESETKGVVLTLKPMPGVTYSPGGSDPPPLPPVPPVATTVEPPPSVPPVPVAPPEPYVRPEPPTSTSSLLGGMRLGWTLPNGDFESNVGAESYAKGGVSFGLQGGLRFARRWLLMGTIERASLGQGSRASTATGLIGDGSSTQSSTLLAATLGYVANPEKVSFYGYLGAGYRWFNAELTDTRALRTVTTTVEYSGPEFLVGIGLWLKLGKWLRLVPKAEVGVGSFSNKTVTCTDNCTVPDLEKATHTFGLLGLAGYYNLDF